MTCYLSILSIKQTVQNVNNNYSNGHPTSNVEETLKKMSAEIILQSTVAKPNYIDLFKGTLLVKTVCSCIIWMITGLTFYGFNQYVSQTSPDPFLTVAAMGAIQVVFLDNFSYIKKNRRLLYYYYNR